jgi:hypothetical protein
MKSPVRIKRPSNILITSALTVLCVLAATIVLYPDKEKIIQAGSVLILVGITWYYALLTRELAKQARESLENEKQKQAASFAENQLQEFYFPFSRRLSKYKSLIKELNWQNFRLKSPEAEKYVNLELTEFILRHFYLCPREVAGFLASVFIFRKETEALKESNEEQFYKQKDLFVGLLDDLEKNLGEKIRDSMEKINKVYHVYDASDFEAIKTIFSVYHGIKKKYDE